ncbi:hypothetical protein P170DRAFT_54529 [Aspergillus steynii IBT 23096]|uniref:Uncharacterized protein n=1 Tax=Aspergillus steynii IBT 23096 TaxID=1392250 RepID=A0A2I2FSA3_9EURO|nr:uncharacterized protein P170DRAFT_54529 [Aspergillus steynii IBT 23096]PLB43515.1 hypothetical protein P170DRAFT_54529 [Aspergillus steynii IBT 23096]
MVISILFTGKRCIAASPPLQVQDALTDLSDFTFATGLFCLMWRYPLPVLLLYLFDSWFFTYAYDFVSPFGIPVAFHTFYSHFLCSFSFRRAGRSHCLGRHYGTGCIIGYKWWRNSCTRLD